MFAHSPSVQVRTPIITHFNNYNKFQFEVVLKMKGQTSFKFADVKETRFLANILIWTQRRQVRGLVNMGKKSGIVSNPLICKKWPLCWRSNAADLLIYEQLTFNVCMYLSKYGLRIEMHFKATYLNYYKNSGNFLFLGRLGCQCSYEILVKYQYLFLLIKQKQS